MSNEYQNEHENEVGGEGQYEIGYYEIGDAADAMMAGEYGDDRWAMGMGGPPQQQFRGAPMRRPMPPGRYPNPQVPQLREREPSKSRQLLVPIDSVSTIAGAASLTISVQPQTLFRPERLVVQGAVAPSFGITDIKVGKDSQFVQSGTIPADAFTPAAFGVRLKCDTAQVSATISVAVTNLSGGALRFLAVIFGESVY